MSWLFSNSAFKTMYFALLIRSEKKKNNRVCYGQMLDKWVLIIKTLMR